MISRCECLRIMVLVSALALCYGSATTLQAQSEDLKGGAGEPSKPKSATPRRTKRNPQPTKTTKRSAKAPAPAKVNLTNRSSLRLSLAILRATAIRRIMSPPSARTSWQQSLMRQTRVPLSGWAIPILTRSVTRRLMRLFVARSSLTRTMRARMSRWLMSITRWSVMMKRNAPRNARSRWMRMSPRPMSRSVGASTGARIILRRKRHIVAPSRSRQRRRNCIASWAQS